MMSQRQPLVTHSDYMLVQHSEKIMNIETLGISVCERSSMLDPLFHHVIFIKNVSLLKLVYLMFPVCELCKA